MTKSNSDARRGFGGLEQRILARLRALNLPHRATVLLGFSGGPDSLALGAGLGRVAPLAGVNVVALHVDHGLRPNSADEQREARRMASEIGLSFRGKRLPDHVRRLHPGVGVEEAARRERYTVFADVAVAEGAAVVALAHHRDDQAETVLLHLLRGTGLSGAVGMTEQSELRVPWWDGLQAAEPARLRVWRPLLDESRADLRAYLEQRGLCAIEDPSNADVNFRRNAVRAAVMPALASINPEASAALARFARLAADDEAALKGLTEHALDRAVDVAGGLSRQALRDEPIALRRRMVRGWLARLAGGLVPTADRVEAIMDRGTGATGGWRVEVGDGWTVIPMAGRLWVGREDGLRRRARTLFGGPLFPEGDAVPRPIAIPGSAIIGDHCFDLSRTTAAPVAVATDRNVVHLTELGETAVLRPPRAGDRWARSGRKVGDWLTRQGVPAMIRTELVCLTTEDAVHWIAGLPLPTFERRSDEHDAVVLTVRDKAE